MIIAAFARQSDLSVFPTRDKVVLDVMMHFRLVGIPTPATIFLYRNVLERIETKSSQAFMPCTAGAITHVSMPEVKDISVNKCSLGLD